MTKSQSSNNIVANFASTPKALLLRYNPSAEIKAYRNQDYTFDKTSPRLVDVFNQMGEDTALNLLKTHLLSYTSMNYVKLPEGDQKQILTTIAQSMYEGMKYWSIGEMLYFFHQLNIGELGDNENYCSIGNLCKKVKKFNQYRLDEETRVIKQKEKNREELIKRIERQCWIQIENLEISNDDKVEMLKKMVNEKLQSLNVK